MRIVDNHRIRIRDIEARFDDIGADQHIIFPLDEIEEGFFEFFVK